MISRRRQQRGYAILIVLMALVIVFILTGSYFSTDTPDGKPWVMTVTDRARGAAASMNYNTARTQWFSTTGGQRLDPQRLRAELDRMSASFGSGGRFFVMNNQQDLRLTTMIETPKFSEQFPLPRER
jgi:hypothetical protein